MRALPFVLIASMLVPVTALGQDRQRVPPEADRSGGGTSGGNSGGSTTNTAAPRESAPAPAPPPAPSAPAPATATPRTSSSSGDPSTTEAQPRQRVPPNARRDQPTSPNRPGEATAVPRPPNQPPRPGGNYHGAGGYNYYYYPRLYYPYGYGAFGLGYFYYDPYAWGAAYGYGYYPPPPFRGYGNGYPTGELRLDVSPRSAEVYVDGYYAGLVDDFDGVFQSLSLEEGTYRIEVVAPGYAPLEFDVRVFPGRKATYQGDLLPVRP